MQNDSISGTVLIVPAVWSMSKDPLPSSQVLLQNNRVGSRPREDYDAQEDELLSSIYPLVCYPCVRYE